MAIAVKKKNGRELFLLLEASMIALEMMGPVNEVVVPTMLKKEKKRNSFPRGVTSEIFFLVSIRSKGRDERARDE